MHTTDYHDCKVSQFHEILPYMYLSNNQLQKLHIYVIHIKLATRENSAIRSTINNNCKCYCLVHFNLLNRNIIFCVVFLHLNYQSSDIDYKYNERKCQIYVIYLSDNFKRYLERPLSQLLVQYQGYVVCRLSNIFGVKQKTNIYLQVHVKQLRSDRRNAFEHHVRTSFLFSYAINFVLNVNSVNQKYTVSYI